MRSMDRKLSASTCLCYVPVWVDFSSFACYDVEMENKRPESTHKNRKRLRWLSGKLTIYRLTYHCKLALKPCTFLHLHRRHGKSIIFSPCLFLLLFESVTTTPILATSGVFNLKKFEKF